MKVTNTETGEEVELSKDEIMKSLQSDQGFIKQIVTMPDGTKKEMAIWGGYRLDGYDRTLNIFVKHDDVSRILETMVEELNKYEADGVEEPKDPCAIEKGYQVSVDYMDAAVTMILRVGKGNVSLDSFVRDERKSMQDTLDNMCVALAEYKSDFMENGSVSERWIGYIILIRSYLKYKGIVQKLYDMYDETAGVVISINKGGEITTKIVKGRERPELPCQVFLMGEQMCRPYIDELMGLKSGGVRQKPVNIDASGSDNIEKDKKKENKNDKKAYALNMAKETLAKRKEKKAEEEEKARQEEEERARKEEEEKKKREMEEWKKRVEDIKKRKGEEERRTLDRIGAEAKEKKEKAANEKDQRKEELSAEIKGLETKRDEETRELDGLGLFKMARKKELKISIESAEKEIARKEEELSKVDRQYDDQITSIEREEKDKKDKLYRDLERNYMIPDSPEVVAEKKRQEEERRREEEERRRQEEEFQKKQKEIENEIWNLLEFGGLCITEFQSSSKILGELSTPRLTSILSNMVKEGKLDRFIDRKKAYFTRKE